ncbi:putative polysaccharide export protein [Desulfonema limicola]|uniref:Polysaccharide export protein n=1 Tax=Desulfonema limicola TaxID=45656 RepID=A0A975B5H7_9BACT|nr:SLBB domain-containing protein [Desulfonema limicola]QTA79176.1 putative polysaccharide export protein [Desulfonema limicola]
MGIKTKKIIKTGLSGLILIQVFFLVFCSLCSAQEESYRIGPRDVLSLKIYAGGEEQQSVEMTVNEQGEINVPFIGTIFAGGLTVSELHNRIFEPMAADYFVNPEINLQIKGYHSLRYYISGAVTSPGLYETQSKPTLMQLIAKAGGVLPDRGDFAYILRDATEQVQGGEDLELLMSQKVKEEVSLVKLLEQVDMSHNPILQSGDVVFIPIKDELKELPSVYVEGEVKSPGIYTFKTGLTALNACIKAGGFTKYAAPNRTRIIRQEDDKQVIIKIDLDSVKKGYVKDFELQPGDLINIPESWL